MAAAYRTFAKIYLAHGNDDQEAAFGPGLIALLRGVRDTGSLNRAAKDMHMAYSKAWKLMNSAEEQLGTKLIERDGARGSTLTDEATRLVTAYDTVNQEISDFATKRLLEEIAKIK